MVPLIETERFTLRVSLLLPLVWMASLIAGRGDSFAMGCLCVSLHEGAHALVLRCLGLPVDRIDLTPVGAFLATSAAVEHRPGAEAAMAFAGPLLNLLLAWGAHAASLRGFLFPQTELFIRLQLVLALGNLLPALPLDGGHILRAALTRAMGLGRSSQAVAWIGYVLSAAFLLGGGYLWLRQGSPTWALFLLPACILPASISAQRSAAWLGIREAEGKHGALRRAGTLPVRSLVIDASLSLHSLLPRLSPRVYHIFTVVDESGRSLGSFTEEGLLRALRSGKSPKAGQILPGNACDTEG